ncbi:olfactory receptor [Branchiostoma belcheri]|nr:olfactory receptor [Branchiostoma belcheri]
MAGVIVEKAVILLYLTLSSLLNPVIYTLQLPSFRWVLREMLGRPRPPTAAVAPALPNLPHVHVIGVWFDSTLNDVERPEPAGTTIAAATTIYACAVKPVQAGHPGDQRRVVTLDRWSP